MSDDIDGHGPDRAAGQCGFRKCQGWDHMSPSTDNYLII
jgi:hypothetical protein